MPAASLQNVPAALFILINAVESNDIEKVRNALLRVKNDGVDINQSNPVEYTALHVAAKNGDLEIAEELIAAGANPNVKSGILSRIPLHLAIWSDKIDMVKFLISAGADMTIKDENGSPALFWIHNRSVDMIRTLISIPGIDLNVRGCYGRTILFGAIYSITGNEFAEILLQHGADPNIIDRDGYTVLAQVIRIRFNDDQVDLVNLLLQYGANPFIKNKHNSTALDVAYTHKATDTIKVLENYFPTFHNLIKWCIRDNKINVSVLPKMIMS